jgi:lipopolysaccharide/colanic/teichoic acid biosynthesis glycosyltransferase
VPKQRLAGIVGAADVTLTLFADDPVFATNSPNKFFDGLAAGKPTIVNVDGWLRRLAEDERTGLYVPAGDPPALAAALAALAAEPTATRAMGTNARRLAERAFDRDSMAERLLAMLADVAPETATEGSVQLPRGFRFPDRAPEITESAALEAAAAVSFYGRRGKRVFDLAVGGLATTLAAPLLAGLAVVVYATSGRPVLFVQERIGRDGVPFDLYKFRSMVPDAVRYGRGYYLEENDPRITWAGRWMRAFSLDELPQLLNVLKGDMSLVGPRPNLAMVVEGFREHYSRILRVKPGITGLVAIRGRNRLRRSEMLRWDEYYVATLSLKNDIRIILETVPSVLLRKGSTDDVSKDFIEDLIAAHYEAEDAARQRADEAEE